MKRMLIAVVVLLCVVATCTFAQKRFGAGVFEDFQVTSVSGGMVTFTNAHHGFKVVLTTPPDNGRAYVVGEKYFIYITPASLPVCDATGCRAK